jgi:hypothetical protein
MSGLKALVALPPLVYTSVQPHNLTLIFRWSP